MNPRRLYARFEKTPISWFDPKTFGFYEAPDKINISKVDDFLSNFNRPTRRRMVHCAPDMPTGDSLIFMDMVTYNVFILGEPRYDQFNQQDYLGMYLAHLVTPVRGGSAGTAEIVRKVAKGPKDDPGWLEPELVAYTYVDVEVSAVVHETQVEEVYENSVLVFMSRAVTCKRFDLIYVDDKIYRVSTMYTDSGLHVAKCFEETDDRVNILYRRSSEGQPRHYDTATRQFIATDRDYKITVRFVKNHNFASWDSESQNYKDLIVDYDNIGFVPNAKDHVIINGVTMEVKVVDIDPAERQYRMRVV